MHELSQIRFVPRKISHHGKHAGYDILFDLIGLKQTRSAIFSKMVEYIPEFILWRLRNMRPQESGKQGLKAELSALRWIIGGRNRVCHFIYGEDTYFFTPLWRTKKNKIIATYHYPPARLCQRVSPGAVKSLDAVVIVGNNQRDYFQHLLPNEDIYFVPHHVDSDYFLPKQKSRCNETIKRGVFVGNCMRDFETLYCVLYELCTAQVNVVFDLLIPRELHEKFSGLDNTKCHSGLADNEMLSLYQLADFGVMPMLDCTANNSVLEMMSCGLPVVVSDVGGIRDYLDEAGGVFVSQGDVSAFVKAIISLIDDAKLLEVKGDHNRKLVNAEFSIVAVTKKMLTVYRKINR